MILDLGSFAFGSSIVSGGGTPSWGTALGQSQPDYKFTYPGAEAMVLGMAYCSVPLEGVTLPLGKGGRIYKASDLRECVLASLFRKVFINGKKINHPFVMVLVKESSESHNGRRSIKYSTKNQYSLGEESFFNLDFIRIAQNTLGLSDDACWFVYKFEIVNQDELHMFAVIVDSEDSVEYESSAERKTKWQSLIPANDLEIYRKSVTSLSHSAYTLQQIFYGAPGTGKSHTIKKTTEEIDSKFVVRTTFHPDSDYSTFVGAYKPKMEVMPRYNPQTGEQMGVEKRIVYAYTPQAFLKAYITAWQNPEQPVYLIIEEINRGNCAQIFGDLFQLLDRGDDGQSCYPIKADQDMQMHLMEVFAGNDALPGNIRSGEELVLPSNLYIWATMNTSDQSLFPIDSAFKRRWEWKYVPITQGRDKGQLLQWSIEAKNEKYDWWSFLEVMNKRVGEITSSEDKKLGFFFCKADGQGVISADKFVSKVMFYLWNDVFKDYPENPIAMYLKEDGGEFTYGDFYTTNAGGEAVVREELVKRLLDELGVEEG